MGTVRSLLTRVQPDWPAMACLLVAAGAALSPDFLSPAFPPGRLGETPLFQALARALPGLFSPRMWSLSRALWATLAAGLLGAGAANWLQPLPCCRTGPLAALAFGGTAAIALLGGQLSQTGITEVGRLTALALGLLAAAMAQVRDFATADEDRRRGAWTLPARYRLPFAVAANMVTVTGAHLLAIYLLLQYIGLRQRVLALLAAALGANLLALARLARRPDPQAARAAIRHVTILFMGVTALYVGAQALL